MLNAVTLPLQGKKELQPMSMSKKARVDVYNDTLHNLCSVREQVKYFFLLPNKSVIRFFVPTMY